MRLSCNGCRILRKGCSESCTIRPCLQWIKSPESQAHATFFLAKFYGRAGLVNLINAGPEHLRPAIFKSLLYEACGRIVNPIYGSAGLLWSGSWQLCQAAVEAVLKGEPIVQVSSELAVGPPVKACDIRHVCKGESKRLTSVPSDQLHKVVKSRSRFKNSAAKKNEPTVTGSGNDESGLDTCNEIGENSSGGEGDCVSAETVEATLVKGDERGDGSDVDLDLDLTLGFGQWGRVNDTCKVHVGVVQPS